jgi:hypothetical protein
MTFSKVCQVCLQSYLAPSTEALSFEGPPATPEAPDEDSEVAEPLAEHCRGPTEDLGRWSPANDVTAPSEEGV